MSVSTVTLTAAAPPQPTQSTHSTLLDDEITALALQLEEINAFSQTEKGKHPVGRPPDTECAKDNFHAEIQCHLSFLKDLKLAHSIANAVCSDAQAIATLTEGEDQALEDRRFAARLNVEDEGCAVPASLCPDDQPFLPNDLDFSDDEDEAGPSMTYADRQANALGKLNQDYKCCVCFEFFRLPSMISLKCRDRYCNGCLKDLCTRATNDETLFPPRCCRQPISLVTISRVLSPEEMTEFRNAELEFSTHDRTYCSNVRCGRFIPPSEVRAGKAECPSCGTSSCSVCKSAYHAGGECPDDPALQATLDLADGEGWQRCYACRALVELDHGCNHMTCKCGAQFCYICGEPWKRCPCDQWNEDRLIARARAVVNREAPRPLPRIEQERQVNVMQENLRDNHECNHSGWLTRIEGFPGHDAFECEICTLRHSRFILRCPRCRMNICATCRRNRLR